MKKYYTSLKIFSIFLIGVLIGFGIGYFVLYESQKIIQIIPQTAKLNFSHVEIQLPAVDQDGNGVITLLKVDAGLGDGKVLTNIDKLLFWVDTQQSIQIAKFVAENLTEINASKYDLVYTIESNASIIGGPSAGAALTIATIAALENKELKNDVMITGTINPDGTIGEVGAILEKAKAAKEFGAKLFLVPLGEGEQTFLQPEEKCVKKLGFIFCETTYKKVTINIGKDAGISVIEVESISDALKYFM